MTDLRAFHQSNVSESAKPVRVGDVVTVYEENKKHRDWKMAVVERLIRGRDEVVRAANIWVIVKEKLMRISRPIQKLYPEEVRTKTPPTTQEKKAKECLIAIGKTPHAPQL